jgi:hypothetical protein
MAQAGADGRPEEIIRGKGDRRYEQPHSSSCTRGAAAVGFGGTYAKATNTGIPAIKFIVVDKLANTPPKAKAVFVAKDLAIDKGTSTDPSLIEVTLDASYDNSVDPPIQGQWEAPAGVPN